MRPINNTPEFSQLREVVVVPPVNETLIDTLQAAQRWPEIADADSLLGNQVQRRHEQSEAIHGLIGQLDNPTAVLPAAIESGHVSEVQAGSSYDALTDLLEDDEYKRLMLYLPMEYIPEASWAPQDPDLSSAVKRFKEAYMNAWHDLLGVHDVRANFVDGDVLEEEHRDGDLPRVVKAAHLMPLLIERGLIAEAEAAELHDTADDPILKQSLAEGLAAYWGASGERYGAVSGIEHEDAPLAATEGRRRWLEQKKREVHIETVAYDVALDLLAGKLPQELVDEALSAGSDDIAAHVLTEGIYKAVEADPTAERCGGFNDTLEALWGHDDPALKERLASVFRRFHRMGLVDASFLADRGINLPNLEGPWSENLPPLAEATDELKQTVAKIETDPELSGLVYPVFLVGGSRVKGYGESGSDIDIGVFVRPNVSEAERTRIRELLEDTVDSNHNYEITEFWLDESESGRIHIHDFNAHDRHTGDSYATHVLFGAAWVGGREIIYDLQRNLLAPYFDGGDDSGAQTDRRLYLEKLEQDALQYRLMHKGYARHYPALKRPEWTRHEAIDGQSEFWDPGYRRLATKLFVNTVFLPKLEL